jgi:hypothetical protein
LTVGAFVVPVRTIDGLTLTFRCRPASAVNGLAWANVDSSCKLNYYVRLSEADKRAESKLLLKDYPMKNLKAMAIVPIRTLELQEFFGNEVSGYQVKIRWNFFRYLS